MKGDWIKYLFKYKAWNTTYCTHFLIFDVCELGIHLCISDIQYVEGIAEPQRFTSSDCILIGNEWQKQKETVLTQWAADLNKHIKHDIKEQTYVRNVFPIYTLLRLRLWAKKLFLTTWKSLLDLYKESRSFLNCESKTPGCFSWSSLIFYFW